MEVVCQNCQKSFYRPKSKCVGKQVFCSRECRSLFVRPLLICKGCGQLYIRNTRMPQNTYCSWECFKKSKWQEVQCVQCGKIFQKRICEIEKGKLIKSKHLCSRACRNSFTSLLLGGDGTWEKKRKYKRKSYGKDWKIAKHNTLERDKHICQQCGFEDRVEVHHWEPYKISFNNTLDNLVTLCHECHQEKHNEYREEGFYESVVSESRWA